MAAVSDLNSQNMYKMMQKLILASASPRRRELLKSQGVEFEIVVSGIDETVAPDEKPESLVERLALHKAEAVSTSHPDTWVLGADTDVSVDGVLLGKPQDRNNAAELLKRIQGRRHVVWGAFALLNQSLKIRLVESHPTYVEIRALTDQEIWSYIDSGESMDKAGAYAAQGVGAGVIESIEGSYTNVVGLNVSAVIRALRQNMVIACKV